MRGVFITFEGCDGSGKSTQIKALAERLAAKGIEPVVTREPGGTPFGEMIRKILLDKEGPDRTPLAEAFLYSSSRNQLVSKVIVPGLDEGRVVVSERFSDSTLVYQGFAGGVSESCLETINEIATLGLRPDLTLILDIDKKVFQKRLGDKNKDRIESRSEEYYSRVRQGYLRLTEMYPERIKIIDASKEERQVESQVWSCVERLLLLRGILK